jgi:hypothetical protein
MKDEYSSKNESVFDYITELITDGEILTYKEIDEKVEQLIN